jgi:hypothetical protein
MRSIRERRLFIEENTLSHAQRGAGLHPAHTRPLRLREVLSPDMVDREGARAQRALADKLGLRLPWCFAFSESFRHA